MRSLALTDWKKKYTFGFILYMLHSYSSSPSLSPPLSLPLSLSFSFSLVFTKSNAPSGR